MLVDQVDRIAVGYVDLPGTFLDFTGTGTILLLKVVAYWRNRVWTST